LIPFDSPEDEHVIPPERAARAPAVVKITTLRRSVLLVVGCFVRRVGIVVVAPVIVIVPGVSVQELIRQEAEGRSVDAVGAGFESKEERAPARTPSLGADAGCIHLKLAYGIHTGF
jgi:hypothetical protein